MKTFSLLFACVLFAAPAAQAQKANDAVEIEHSGTWYPGKILQAEGDRFFITYDGWSETWNEWVGRDRIRGYSASAPADDAPANTGKFQVGDRVEVEYGMLPAAGRIVYVGENKYEVEFDNKPWGKKWYTEKQIKKL
ncbi:MAG: agenet domain-containing protein [Flavobacteriales bacterium]|jgi:hypothetical protein|nr:agenet domain-containing protein [Flavobacteriales bacterium]